MIRIDALWLCSQPQDMRAGADYRMQVAQNLLTQLKMIGTYTVPRVDVQVSGTFQSVPGPALSAIYNAPAAVYTHDAKGIGSGCRHWPVAGRRCRPDDNSSTGLLPAFCHVRDRARWWQERHYLH